MIITAASTSSMAAIDTPDPIGYYSRPNPDWSRSGFY